MTTASRKSGFGASAATAEFETTFEESEEYRKSLVKPRPASATDSPAAASPALRKAWDSYYATIDEMRALLENTSMFKNPRYRAKAYHSIMEVQASCYNLAVAPRMTTPRIQTNSGWHDDYYQMANVGADWHYGLMFLDGAHTYRLTGRMGENKLLLIQVLNKPLGMPNGKTIGNFNLLADMEVAPDGSYEVTIGGPKTKGNWIGLDETSNCNFAFIRRQYLRYGNEDMGSYRIDRVTPVGPEYYEREEFNEAEMAERIHRAEMLMRIYIVAWTLGIHDFSAAGGPVNTMHLEPGLVYEGASPLSRYAQGLFSIKDDEALIIELDRTPDSLFWGMSLADVWSRTLPFTRYQTSLNCEMSKRDSDGHYRFVLSIHDPGVANWLDPTGHNDGILYLRNYLAREPVTPIVRKVKFKDVMANLPADTATVTPEQRQAALNYRRDGFRKVYGE